MGNHVNCLCSHSKCLLRRTEENIDLSHGGNTNSNAIQLKKTAITAEKMIEASFNFHCKSRNNSFIKSPRDEMKSSLLQRLKTYNLMNSSKREGDELIKNSVLNSNNNLLSSGVGFFSPKTENTTSQSKTGTIINSNNINGNHNNLNGNFIEGKIISDENILSSLRNVINNHPLFAEMTENIKSYLTSNFYLYFFSVGTYIYEEGAFGNFFFVVYKGHLEITTEGSMNGNEKSVTPVTHKKISPWDCFGERCLISDCRRNEKVLALTNVELLVLDSFVFKECLHKIADEKYKERFEFINTLSFFQPLDAISKYLICENVREVSFRSHKVIIKQNDVGDAMYIIKKGKVSCKKNGVEVRQLSSKDYFGQNAILFNAKRTLDVISITEVVCFMITKDDLMNLFGDSEYKDKIIYSFFKSIVTANEILKDVFIDSISEKIYHAFLLKFYKFDEDVAISEYESGNSGKIENKVLVVLDGGLYKENSRNECVAKRGDVLGVENIYDNKAKSYSEVLDIENCKFKANPDCITLECNIEKLVKIICDEFTGGNSSCGHFSAKQNSNKAVVLNPLKLLNRITKLQKCYLFQHLSKQSLEKIALKMQKQKYKKSEIIVSENSVGNTFFLIKKGRVRVSKDGKILRDLEKGNCFGELALLEANNKRTATVVAIENKVIVYVLSKNDLDLILDDANTKEYLVKKLALQDSNISLDQLKVMHFLGKGKFGNVYLVHNNKTIYAIKSITKSSVSKQKMLSQYFINERRVMLTLDHPFIVKLVKTLKNSQFVFFLIEYINGCPLDHYLSYNKNTKGKVRLRNIDETTFYSASLMLIVDYLHKKYIAHRDIKPANIMINTNGYIKLIDFGTAKVLKDYTSTVIGTPHYIAPEVLKGKGYSMSCDYWSVGITIFEIFYGYYPFGNAASDVVEIYNEIINKKLYFPNFNGMYNNMNSFISGLLCKDVSERCCNLNILKREVVFEGFDWDALIDFKLTAPYLPEKRVWKDLKYYTEKFEDALGGLEMLHRGNTKKGLGRKVAGSTNNPNSENDDWSSEF